MLILPEELREEVRKPFGRVLQGEELKKALEQSARPIIAVGDRCAHDLIKAGTPPDMLIFDFKIRRVEIPKEMKQQFALHASSPYVVLSAPGQISDQLVSAVERLLADGSGAIFVVGEDDLSSLLVMAKSEAGTLVYGQPEQGAVIVPLGGKSVKQKAQGFLDRMGKA